MKILPDDLYLTGLKRLFGGDAFAGIKPTFEAAASRLGSLSDKAGANGLSLEAGREAFDLLLRDYGKEIGLQNAEIRMLPMRHRARKGFEALAGWFKSAWGWESTVSFDAASLKFSLISIGKERDSHYCSPFCYFVEGLLQGLLFWASGGRYYEARCAVQQGSFKPVCEFNFSNTPID